MVVSGSHAPVPWVRGGGVRVVKRGSIPIPLFDSRRRSTVPGG